MDIDFNRAVKAHIAIRDKRAEMKKAYEAEDDGLKEKQRKIEAVLLKHLQDTNAESSRTASGTFYRQESIKPSAGDWQAFYDWIKENDAFDALERRIKSAFIKEHMETHAGELPPGVSVHREYEIRVRRA